MQFCLITAKSYIVYVPLKLMKTAIVCAADI